MALTKSLGFSSNNMKKTTAHVDKRNPTDSSANGYSSVPTKMA